MAIRALFFDAGDTLVYLWALKAERFAWLCRESGLSLPDEPERLLAGARAQERFFQDRRSHTDAWSKEWYLRMNRAGLEAMGLEGDLDDLAARIFAFSRTAPRRFEVDPDAPALLEWLRSRGYRLAIISNWDGSLIDALRPTGLAGYFDAVLDSDVVGSRKPDTRMYELACAITGVRPEEAMHIGDSPAADVAGALAAGLRPVLLDALDAFTGGFPGLPPFERVQRLSQLPALLNG